MEIFQSINPLTGKLLREYPGDSTVSLKQKVLLANNTFDLWRKSGLKERSEIIERIGIILLKRKSTYALLITKEMGKKIDEANAEIEKCAWLCSYYAKEGLKFLTDKRLPTEHKSFISYSPSGVILGIMPWNYPFWQVLRFAIPTILSGNVVLMKHATNVSGCSIELTKLFTDAGASPGIFQSVFISHSQTASLIRNKVVKGVSLTGSTTAGKKVAATAGGAIKPCLLELGGSDPYIILNDANIILAAEKCATSRLLNAGQSCIGAKRFIVEESVYNTFLSQLLNRMASAKYGDPMKDEFDIGPLAKIEFRDTVHKQVTDSISKGAECITGGYIPDKKGAFYPATVLINVKKGMPAYSEEIFGPVASVFKVKNVEEAIHVANDTDYGLGAAIFSSDVKKAEQIARENIFSGSVAINDFVRSDPRVAFGGIKSSGFGRELGEQGLHSFINLKSISIF